MDKFKEGLLGGVFLAFTVCFSGIFIAVLWDIVFTAEFTHSLIGQDKMGFHKAVMFLFMVYFVKNVCD